MKKQGTTHRRILFLLSFTWWLTGICAQVPDTLANAPTVVADTLSTAAGKSAPEIEVPLDTAIVDSLLMKGLMKNDKRFFKPDPIRSMWLALIIPGGGQVYNRKFWKLPIVYGGFLGCTYALTWNNQMLRDYSQAYLDIMDDDPNTKSYEDMLPLGYDMTGKEDRFKTIFKNKKDHFRKFRDLSIFAFVGVYLISVIDAYVDAELSSFDVSRDLSIHLEPAIINTGVPTMKHQKHSSYGLSCSIIF